MADSQSWYGVRCLFRIDSEDENGEALYEERVTIWHAESSDAAIEMAEADAAEYADVLDVEYLEFAQVYQFDGEPTAGAEVFSLMRGSTLAPTEYLNTFFDTGKERQEHTS